MRGGTPAQDEAFRVLRARLLVTLSDVDRPTVLVTSAHAGEGKTATVAGLGRALAQAGHRVVVVDLDLRSPDAHEWFDARSNPGATDVLLDDATLEDCLQYVELGGGGLGVTRGMYVLAAGRRVDAPAELLASARTAKLLDALREQADIVLIDSAPVLAVADALALGRIASGALLVVENRKTALGAAHAAKDALIRNQTRLLGVVLNRFESRDAAAGFGYGYGAGYGYGDANTSPTG